MGDDSWLLGMVCFDTVEETLFEDVLEAFLRNEFTAGHGGEGSVEAAVEHVREGSGSELLATDGSVEVWYDGDESGRQNRTYTLGFHPDEPADDLAPITLRVPGTRLDHTVQDHDVQPEVEALVDASETLAEAVDPWVAVLAVMPDGRKVPTGRLPDHGIEKLPFVTVFGPAFLDHVGGREHVLAAPVYETRALGTGGVLVRTRDKPIVKHPLDEGPSGSPEKHVLEGRSAADRERFVDPFHELAEGELATDPVLCESHAPFEWERVDYAAFPELPERDEHCHVLCVRRDGEKLWEAHNGEFIRRLIDEDGQPIGTLPEGVPPHQEFVSTAIRTAYEDDPPMHMYRMDALDEPSVYARLRGMDAVPEGESIWEGRETPVTR